MVFTTSKRENSATSRDLCFSSITKITSAQRMSSAETLWRAFGLVPAEWTEISGCWRKICSAVALRHWLRLQMNKMFSCCALEIGCSRVKFDA